MKDPVHLAIVMERDDVDKLSQLTTAQTQPQEDLAQLIRLLHEEQERQGHAGDFENLVHKMQVLTERRARLEQRVLSLTRRLDALIIQYAELLSRVHTLSQFLKLRGGRLSH